MLFGSFRFATIAKSILNPQALYVRNWVGASLFTNLIHLYIMVGCRYKEPLNLCI